MPGYPPHGVMPTDPPHGRESREASKKKLAAGGSLGIKNDDGGGWGPMGCGWGADEAGLRVRGGPILRGFVDVLDR